MVSQKARPQVVSTNDAAAIYILFHSEKHALKCRRDASAFSKKVRVQGRLVFLKVVIGLLVFLQWCERGKFEIKRANVALLPRFSFTSVKSWLSAPSGDGSRFH